MKKRLINTTFELFNAKKQLSILTVKYRWEWKFIVIPITFEVPFVVETPASSEYLNTLINDALK